MESFIIEGGNKIFGKVNIAPAKNACLPIIASSLAFPTKIFLKKAPRIKDVCAMADIVKSLGGSYTFDDSGLTLENENINSFVGDKQIYGSVRASLFSAGALLSRFKKAVIPFPGGCNIGSRPVDIHIDALKALGANVRCLKDVLEIDGANMRCGYVKLCFPSVGATVNAISAAIFLNGETVVSNAAKEPEIIDLCNFLNTLGCKVYGGGTSVVRIQGIKRDSFDKISYKPIFDRIEAGTFMLCCLSLGGELSFEAECFKPIESFSKICAECGAETGFSNGTFFMRMRKKPLSVNCIADVYPAFPTDLQPQLVAALIKGKGRSYVYDKVFPERFSYLKELSKFGAKTDLLNGGVKIYGVKKLKGANVVVPDLRAGAALCIAALSAEGLSVIERADVIRRGYMNFDEKLRMLGCKIVHNFN